MPTGQRRQIVRLHQPLHLHREIRLVEERGNLGTDIGAIGQPEMPVREQ